MEDNIQLKVYRAFIRWLKDYNVYPLWVKNTYNNRDSVYTLDNWFKRLYTGTKHKDAPFKGLITNAPFLWNASTQIGTNGFTIDSHYDPIQITTWLELGDEWQTYFNTNKEKIYGN